MSKKTIRIWTDLLMFFTMCFLIGTGLLIHYRLLPGSRGGHGLNMFGLTRHEWGSWHLYASFLLILLTLVNLILNYTFIKNAIA